MKEMKERQQAKEDAKKEQEELVIRAYEASLVAKLKILPDMLSPRRVTGMTMFNNLVGKRRSQVKRIRLYLHWHLCVFIFNIRPYLSSKVHSLLLQLSTMLLLAPSPLLRPPTPLSLLTTTTAASFYSIAW